MKALLALMAATLLVAACAPTSPSPSPRLTASPSPSPSPGSPSPSPGSPSPSPAALVDVAFGNGTFKAPASWHVVTPRAWTAPVGPILFLSDAPIADPCPTGSLDADCWKPLATLPPSSIIVTFAGSATLSLPNPSPVPSEIALHDWCRAIRGDREMSTPFPGYVVFACLRGPDTAVNATLFAELVSSLAG